MTKRYSHGMQERKREALEKLVSFSPRQRDAKNLKTKKRQGRSPAVKCLIDWSSKVGSNPRPLRCELDSRQNVSESCSHRRKSAVSHSLPSQSRSKMESMSARRALNMSGALCLSVS